MKELTDYIPLVTEASLKAGKAILKIYSTTFEVEKKDDSSPLTEADKRSHEIISGYLSGTGIPVLSEEGHHTPYSERRKWNTLWIVDPLDGTKEFVRRNGEFTVNIALVQKKRPVLGIIYAPVLDILYFAVHNKGAYKLGSTHKIMNHIPEWEELSRQSVKLPLDKRPREFTVVGSRSHLNKETEQFIENLRIQHGNIEISSRGSSLKFCMIAEGIARVYPRFAPTSEWDTAAGHIIAEESGGRVLQQDLEHPLIYNKENILNPGFVVFRPL